MPATVPGGDLLWDAVRHRGQPRLLFVSRPGPEVRRALQAVLDAQRIGERLGRAGFDPDNWHQSLSDRYLDTARSRQQLLEAGQGIAAQAVGLRFERVQSPRNQRGNHNWELRGDAGERDLLLPLVGDIKRSIAAAGLAVGGERNRPHITLSYGADAGLARDLPVAPVEWLIDTVDLVLGAGRPYRYTTLGRWTLAPAAHRVVQGGLF